MAFSYYLLQFPPFLLFLSIIIFGGIITGVGTYLFRNFGRIKVLKSHNEVTGFLFTAIASFYSLLLGFVVFVVWSQLNDTQSNVSQEGSSAFGLYRDIKFYPDPKISKLMMVVYLDFVFDVIDDEAGVTPGLVRLSLGLENIVDIKADLEAGFKATKG